LLCLGVNLTCTSVRLYCEAYLRMLTRWLYAKNSAVLLHYINYNSAMLFFCFFFNGVWPLFIKRLLTYLLITFFPDQTFSSVNRFCRNFATGRRFIGNRKLALQILLGAPRKKLGDKNILAIFWTPHQDFTISFRNAKEFYNYKQ